MQVLAGAEGDRDFGIDPPAPQPPYKFGGVDCDDKRVERWVSRSLADLQAYSSRPVTTATSAPDRPGT